MTTILTNQIGAQGVWLACVLGAAAGRPWLGVVAAALWLAFHLQRSQHLGREVALVASAALLGTVVDVVLVRGELLRYASQGPWSGFGPLWMVALWMGFATTLNVSLRWLQARPLVAVATGAIFGPLAYLGGERLGGVTFATDPATSLSAVAVAWAISLPLLTALAAALNTPRRVAG